MLRTPVPFADASYDHFATRALPRRRAAARGAGAGETVGWFGHHPTIGGDAGTAGGGAGLGRERGADRTSDAAADRGAPDPARFHAPDPRADHPSPGCSSRPGRA